jgi:multidrug efflux pump subunit AcrA (membrane-fusion protein)
MVFLFGCRGGEDEAKSEVRPVRTVTIESRDSSGAINLTGRVQAQSEVNQSFRLDGQLIERLVDVGDSVQPGQLIARLDSQNEESGLQSAQAQLVAAQVQLLDAQNNFNRMRDLVVDDAVSRASYDHAEAVLKTTEAQLKSVQSQLTLAQNRFTRLHADVAGGYGARSRSRRGGFGRAHDCADSTGRIARCDFRCAGADRTLPRELNHRSLADQRSIDQSQWPCA